MKIVIKSLFLIFLLETIISIVFVNQVLAQYIVKCEFYSWYDKSSVCGSDNYYFSNVKIVSPITYTNNTNFSYCSRTYAYTSSTLSKAAYRSGNASCSSVLASYSGDYNQDVIETVYVETDENSIALVFDADDFVSTLGVDPYGYAIKYPVSRGYLSGWNQQYASKSILACKREGKMFFKVTTYDVPELLLVDFPNCSNCEGNTICVESINDTVSFYYFSLNNGNNNIYVEISNSSGSVLKTVNLGTLVNGAGSKKVTINDLSLQDYYGKDIMFRFKMSMGGKTTYSSYSSVFTLFKQASAPTGSITCERRACDPQILIKVPLDETIVQSLGSYKFRTIAGSGTSDDLSNVIRLVQYGSITSDNIITLKPHDDDKSNMLKGNGIYTLQIFQNLQDENNEVAFSDIQCAVTSQYTLGAAIDLLSITATPIPKATIKDTAYHVSTNGGSDGEATLVVSGGAASRIGTFQYYNSGWKTIPASQLTYVNSTTRKFTGLIANKTYKVRIVDSDGCNSDAVTFSLNQPSKFTFNDPSVINTVTCHRENALEDSTETPDKHNDGSIALSYSGGIPEYNVSVDGTVKYTHKSLRNLSVTGLSEGTHSIRVYNDYGDGITKTVYVGQNDKIEVDISYDSIKCYGNNTNITFAPMNLDTNKTVYYQLYKSNVLNEEKYSNVFYSKTSDNYTINVTNNGCVAVEDFYLSQPNDIIISATPSKIAAYGDSTGTIALAISEGTGDFDYTVYKGTTAIDSGTTTKDALITDLAAGYYKVEVTDDNSCPQSLSGIQVRQPDAPLALSFYQDQLNVDCYGNATGEVYPLASGGWGHYQYGFNGTVYGTETTIGGLSATGDIPDTVFVVDSAGIIAKQPVTITEPTVLLTSIDSIYNLHCFEDSTGALKLDISGGTSGYRVSFDTNSWTEGDSLYGLSVMENQTLYIKDANGCPETETITITQPDLLVTTVDTIIDAFCNKYNGGIIVNVTGGTEKYNYDWVYVDHNYEELNNNSDTLESVLSGQYSLMVTDAHGCQDSLSTSISDLDGPEITSYSIDSISCYNGADGKLTIKEVSGGMPSYSYYLNDVEGDTLFTGLESATYHCRVVDQKGCKTDKYYFIPQPNNISIEETIVAPICHDSFDGYLVTQITGGNGGYTYLWSNGVTDKDLEDLNSGSFTITVTDRKECQKIVTYEVIPPDMPTANLEDNNYGILCTGNSMELDGGDFVTYQWYKDGVSVSTDRYITVDETGQYVLQITNTYGCVGLDTFDLEVSDSPLDATLLVQDSATVSEVVVAIDVTWPVPDSIQWFFDFPVKLYDSSYYSQEFASTSTGVINVTLRAWYGGCFSDSSKTVTIYAAEEEEIEELSLLQPVILGFRAYPNPNDGDFNVEVNLSKEADIILRLFGIMSGNLLDTEKQYGLDSYEIPYNLTTLKPGVYILVLTVENEQQKLKIVIE